MHVSREGFNVCSTHFISWQQAAWMSVRWSFAIMLSLLSFHATEHIFVLAILLAGPLWIWYTSRQQQHVYQRLSQEYRTAEQDKCAPQSQQSIRQPHHIEERKQQEQQNTSVDQEESGWKRRQQLQQLYHRRQLDRLGSTTTPPPDFKSGLCTNCQEFFLRPLNVTGDNIHSERVSTIHQNAKYGCPVCAFFCRKMKNVPISPDESLGFSLGLDCREARTQWLLHSGFGKYIYPAIDFRVMPYDGKGKAKMTNVIAD